jgi:hypothetical protein
MKVITWFDNAQFSKFCSYKTVKYIINTYLYKQETLLFLN